MIPRMVRGWRSRILPDEIVVQEIGTISRRLHHPHPAAVGRVRERLLALCVTSRIWSLGHPIEVELICGRPFPGYRPPEKICPPPVAACGTGQT